jgi:hypothetical protein
MGLNVFHRQADKAGDVQYRPDGERARQHVAHVG